MPTTSLLRRRRARTGVLLVTVLTPVAIATVATDTPARPLESGIAPAERSTMGATAHPVAMARHRADTAWRARVRAFAEAHLQHTAWGPAHGRRDYELTLALARAEGITVDDDALYAAGYLHDMGGLPPYAKQGVDHGDRGVQVVDSVLRGTGFPMEKAPLVKEIIGHHMYYRPPGTAPEAILFRDADILDFLGAIDIARIVSLTTRERWAPDLPHAIAVVEQNMREMLGKLQTASAKREAQHRVQEMQAFLDALRAETDSLRTL
jgi:uncharacterized protein